MANHKSAKKAARQANKRNTRNSARSSKIKSVLKAARSATSGNNTESTKSAVILAQKELDEGVTKGLIKKNTASRLKSRLAKAAKKAAGK